MRRRYIANPLNIKRSQGDLPTAKSSSKNVFILLISFAVIGLTANKVWGFALYYVKSPLVTGVLLAMIYGFIIFKIFSVSVFEEKKQVKAYRDFLENKNSDISTVWEILDIKTVNTMGRKFAYVDYIDGTRTVIIKCEYGSINNLDDNAYLRHVEMVNKVMRQLDTLKYLWHPHSMAESTSDDEQLAFYSNKIANYSDPEYVSFFVDILDVIDYVGKNESKVTSIYFEVTCSGKLKHRIFKDLASIPNQLKSGTQFQKVTILSEEYEIERFLAHTGRVSSFDREELQMMKYKSSSNLGQTAVLSAYNREGATVKVYNKEIDATKKVKRVSYRLSATKGHVGSMNRIKPEIIEKKPVHLQMLEKEIEVKKQAQQSNEDEILVGSVKESNNKTFIEILYSDEKVKLG